MAPWVTTTRPCFRSSAKVAPSTDLRENAGSLPPVLNSPRTMGVAPRKVAATSRDRANQPAALLSGPWNVDARMALSFSQEIASLQSQVHAMVAGRKELPLLGDTE